MPAWSGNVRRYHERVGAEFFTQLHERDLCRKPQWVLRYAFHGLDGIVANQENALAKDHKRLETRPHPVTRKFVVSHVRLPGQQAGAQRPGVREKVFLKP